MKGLRYITVWDFLNTIQTKAKANVSIINQNNLKIEEYRHLSRISSIESGELVDRLMKENKELMEENSMLLTLHQKILTFSNEVKLLGVKPNQQVKEEVIPDNKMDEKNITPTSKECVSWVLDKFILLDEDHPCLCDEKIVDEIYQALIDNERYEECQILMKLKEKHHVKK
jgi:hypothetical protein